MPERGGAGLISVVGGESTGKSTLAAALGLSLPGVVVGEHLRTWVEEHGGRVPSAVEQAAVAAAQRESEIAAKAVAAGRGLSWAVSDSGPLMTAVYSIQYFNDHTLLPSAIHDITNADLVVWCAPDVPWQPDGKHRDGPQARDLTDQLIRSQIEPALTGTRLIRVSGSPANRLDKVLTALGSSTP